MLSKVERLQRSLSSDPVDRPAYSFWTHFPEIDLDPPALVAATVELARALDLDFVKAMPNGLYAVEDWGVVASYDAIKLGGVAEVVRPAVEEPEDWRRLRRLDPKEGALGRELQHLSRLVAALGPGLPVIATTFSPLTIAKKLGEAACRQHMQSHPGLVLDALSEIAATVAAFSREAIRAGCAGVFFAVQEATRKAGDANYDRFGEPFDLVALAGAADGWFNVVHMHGDDILFNVLARYPVAALNWHVGETAPSIAEYRESGGRKPVVGGMRRMAITGRDRTAIDADIAAALSGDGRGVILSPGCVIRHPVDIGLLTEIAGGIRALARS